MEYDRTSDFLPPFVSSDKCCSTRSPLRFGFRTTRAGSRYECIEEANFTVRLTSGKIRICTTNQNCNFTLAKKCLDYSVLEEHPVAMLLTFGAYLGFFVDTVLCLSTLMGV